MSDKEYPKAPYSSAAKRNRQPILDQLQLLLPASGTVLEVGSGTGEHAVWICRELTGLQWQPSDRAENLQGLRIRFDGEANARILPLLKLDVLTDVWPQETYDAAYSANTAHIMSWQAVEAMFTGVAQHLAKGAKFCLYGPFNIDGQFTAESNAAFDMQLRSRDPEMGIRDMAALESLAADGQMYLERKIPMPANNFILVFIKK